MRKIVLFTLLVMLAALSTGCGAPKVKVTAADNGGEVEVGVGQRFVVELEGNPSTGYTWQAQDLDTSMFQQIGEPEFKSSNPGLVGAGGTLRLTFQALQAGKATLTLVYCRPWETDVEPLDVFTVNVTVK